MATTLPTFPPVAATAGDTWEWTDTNTTYPASDGWVVAYRFVGKSKLTWDASWASVSDNTTTLTIPATSTLLLSAGSYKVYAEYSLSGVRHTVVYDPCQVAANPAMLQAGDTCSYAEILLPKVEEAITARMTGGAVAYYMIGSRQVGNIPLPELLALRAQLRMEVAAERGGQVKSFGTTIKYRMKQPQ